MARSKKKTLSQNVVNVATTGMPEPVKKILGGRFVALLIVLCVPILCATGIVSVKWANGRPKIVVNEQRAAQLEEEAVKQIQELKNRRGQGGAPTVNIPPLLDRQSNESMSERIEGWKAELDQKLDGKWR